MTVAIYLVCLALGALTESLSHFRKLWSYRRPWSRLTSVLLVFGLLFGVLSSALMDHSPLIRFALGAVAGISYEAANLYVLHIFQFHQPLSRISNRAALALIAGLPWGLLPWLAPLLATFVLVQVGQSF